MKPFIFEEKNGLYIIDLAKTLGQLKRLFLAFKNYRAREIYFVCWNKNRQNRSLEKLLSNVANSLLQRWLGGMLTNMATIRNSVKTLNRIELDLEASNSGLTKKRSLY